MMQLVELPHRALCGGGVYYPIGQKQNILRYVDKGWFSRAEIAR